MNITLVCTQTRKQRPFVLHYLEFYHTLTELEGSKVSSTIRPPTGAHCFRFLQLGALCKAPTTSFHHNFVLWNFTTPSQN